MPKSGLRHGIARRHGIDIDPRPGQLPRQGTSEREHRALRCHIVEEKRRAQIDRTRRNVDDPAFALLLHGRHDRFAAQPYSLDVDRHHLIPAVFCDLLKGRHLC